MSEEFIAALNDAYKGYPVDPNAEEIRKIISTIEQHDAPADDAVKKRTLEVLKSTSENYKQRLEKITETRKKIAELAAVEEKAEENTATTTELVSNLEDRTDVTISKLDGLITAFQAGGLNSADDRRFQTKESIVDIEKYKKSLVDLDNAITTLIHNLEEKKGSENTKIFIDKLNAAKNHIAAAIKDEKISLDGKEIDPSSYGGMLMIAFTTIAAAIDGMRILDGSFESDLNLDPEDRRLSAEYTQLRTKLAAAIKNVLAHYGEIHNNERKEMEGLLNKLEKG